MFCSRCGRYNPDGVKQCKYCGSDKLQTYPVADSSNANGGSTIGERKTVVGVLLCLFLGVLGLIIGLLLYPANSEERSTFLSGWLKTLVVEIVLAIVLVIGLVSCASCLATYY